MKYVAQVIAVWALNQLFGPQVAVGFFVLAVVVLAGREIAKGRRERHQRQETLTRLASAMRAAADRRPA